MTRDAAAGQACQRVLADQDRVEAWTDLAWEE
jgi:hypothetical protein